MRSVILKSIFVVLAAASAIALAFASVGAALQFQLWTSPGLYVWARLHPDPHSNSIATFFLTVLSVDSVCWFIVLCAAGWWLTRKTRRRKGAPESEDETSVALWVLCACLLGFLGLVAFRMISSRHQSEERVAAYQRGIAEAPPMVEAPAIKLLPGEQILIVRQIAGFYPWLPDSRIVAQAGPVSPTVGSYSVGYTTTENPGIDSVRRVVAVEITEFPNAEWARYRVNHNQVYVGLGSGESLAKVQKFGQSIIQDASNRNRDASGTLCFFWPHDTFVVSVCYETPEVNEEFIREYLEKYPSSL